MWPFKYDWGGSSPRERWLRGIFMSMRLLLALLGMMMVWVGMYNLIDDDIAGYSGALTKALLAQPCLALGDRATCTADGCEWNSTGYGTGSCGPEIRGWVRPLPPLDIPPPPLPLTQLAIPPDCRHPGWLPLLASSVRHSGGRHRATVVKPPVALTLIAVR